MRSSAPAAPTSSPSRRSGRCARSMRRVTSSSSTSSSTALSRAKKASSARAWSRTCRWPTRPARACPGLCADAAEAAGATTVRGGTYLAMEGPQFSSRAESLLYRQWGCDVIGMTAMPEAKLAREAELPYALVGMVTDYDCWRGGEEAVEVAAVIAQLMANADGGARPRRALAAFAAARAHPLADRYRARQCDHHRARSARSGATGTSSTRCARAHSPLSGKRPAAPANARAGQGKTAQIARRATHPAVASPAFGRGQRGRGERLSRRRPSRRARSTSSISASARKPPLNCKGGARRAAPGRHKAGRTAATRSATPCSMTAPAMLRRRGAARKKAASSGAAAMCAVAAACQSSPSRVSAWRKSSQSPRAAAAPACICAPRPRGAAITRAPVAVAIETLASLDPPSTTTTSSAPATEARHAPRSSPPFSTGMTTLSSVSPNNSRRRDAEARAMRVVEADVARRAAPSVSPRTKRSSRGSACTPPPRAQPPPCAG